MNPVHGHLAGLTTPSLLISLNDLHHRLVLGFRGRLDVDKGVAVEAFDGFLIDITQKIVGSFLEARVGPYPFPDGSFVRVNLLTYLTFGFSIRQPCDDDVAPRF